MDTTIFGRELLGKYVDELIARKYPDQPSVNFAKLREDAIVYLDNRIADGILVCLTEEQLDDFQSKLEGNELNTPEAMRTFYDQCGLDLDAVMKKTVDDFANEFLGVTQDA